jgi:hypothetical protein
MEYQYEQLRTSETIPDAHEMWRGYRDALTAYVLSNLTPKSKIAILGAGECNDIDLKRVVEKGHQVTLLDRDESAMKRGVARAFGAGEAVADVQIRTVDIWQISPVEYHELEEMLYRREQMSVIIAWLKQLTQRLCEMPISLGCGYDTVVAAGVHSQVNVLFVSLLQTYMQQGICYEQHEIAAYLAQIADMNRSMTEHLQPALLDMAKRHIYAYEYASFDAADERIYDVIDLFYKGRSDLAAKQGICRVEGAIQLERTLSRLIFEGTFTVVSFQYLVWPFTKEKKYLVIAYELKRRGYNES